MATGKSWAGMIPSWDTRITLSTGYTYSWFRVVLDPDPPESDRPRRRAGPFPKGGIMRVEADELDP
jgi:hypothetical protein